MILCSEQLASANSSFTGAQASAQICVLPQFSTFAFREPRSLRNYRIFDRSYIVVNPEERGTITAFPKCTAATIVTWPHGTTELFRGTIERKYF
jgi:hypothetical protein